MRLLALLLCLLALNSQANEGFQEVEKQVANPDFNYEQCLLEYENKDARISCNGYLVQEATLLSVDLKAHYSGENNYCTIFEPRKKLAQSYLITFHAMKKNLVATDGLAVENVVFAIDQLSAALQTATETCEKSLPL